MATMITVDRVGRMVLPKKVREKLGLVGEGVAVMEVKGSEVLLKRSKTDRSPSKAISKMNLPIGPWEEVEGEIEEGMATE